jgi:hypothetical protein
MNKECVICREEQNKEAMSYRDNTVSEVEHVITLQMAILEIKVHHYDVQNVPEHEGYEEFNQDLRMVLTHVILQKSGQGEAYNWVNTGSH